MNKERHISIPVNKVAIFFIYLFTIYCLIFNTNWQYRTFCFYCHLKKGPAKGLNCYAIGACSFREKNNFKALMNSRSKFLNFSRQGYIFFSVCIQAATAFGYSTQKGIFSHFHRGYKDKILNCREQYNIKVSCMIGNSQIRNILQFL